MSWPSSTMATKWPIGGDGYKTIAASIAMSLWVCSSVLALGSYMYMSNAISHCSSCAMKNVITLAFFYVYMTCLLLIISHSLSLSSFFFFL